MAKNSITYDKKRYLIILVFILLLAVTYKKVFSTTIQTISEYYEVNDQSIDSISLNSQLRIARMEIERLDVILGDESFDENRLQQDILRFISEHKGKKRITIASLEKTHTFQSDNYAIISNNLTMQGNYNDLMEMVYTLERQFESSKITSVKLYKKRNNRRQRDELYVQIIFQNYRYL